jgi:hypothetical protein
MPEYAAIVKLIEVYAKSSRSFVDEDYFVSCHDRCHSASGRHEQGAPSFSQGG